MNTKMQSLLNFAVFYNIAKSHKLSMKTAYKLAQLNKAIQGEVDFYREKFQALAWEYGQVDESGQLIPTADGTGITLKPGTEPECYAALQELENLEVTLPDIKFSLDEFASIKLTTAEIEPILPFIEE